MSNPARLRAGQRQLREAHRKLFDLQGESISALREALNAISKTHDQMMALFAADNELEHSLDEDDKPEP